MSRGLLEGHDYAPVARKGRLALVEQLNRDDRICDVCVGTNKASNVVGSDLVKQRDYYLARPTEIGDQHGQAPVLWCAKALLQ